MNRKADLEVLESAKPFVRGAVALLIFLVKGKAKEQIDACYEAADIFIGQVERDLKAGDK